MSHLPLHADWVEAALREVGPVRMAQIMEGELRDPFQVEVRCFGGVVALPMFMTMGAWSGGSLAQATFDGIGRGSLPVVSDFGAGRDL